MPSPPYAEPAIRAPLMVSMIDESVVSCTRLFRIAFPVPAPCGPPVLEYSVPPSDVSPCMMFHMWLYWLTTFWPFAVYGEQFPEHTESPAWYPSLISLCR